MFLYSMWIILAYNTIKVETNWNDIPVLYGWIYCIIIIISSSSSSSHKYILKHLGYVRFFHPDLMMKTYMWELFCKTRNT